MITAVKPVWDGKKFEIVVHRDVHSLGTAVQSGFIVYDDAARLLSDVKASRMVPQWSERKRAALIAFLESEVAG